MPGGRLVGTRVVLDYPSRTATDNLMMAAVLAKGAAVIENADRVPEVADLAESGAPWGRTAGGGHVAHRGGGVDELPPTRHTVVPDRVVAGTFLAAVGLDRGG